MSLLDHVRKFVRQQAQSRLCLQGILPGPESDIRPYGVRPRAQFPRRRRRTRTGVKARLTEIVAEAICQVGTRRCWYGMASALECLDAGLEIGRDIGSVAWPGICLDRFIVPYRQQVESPAVRTRRAQDLVGYPISFLLISVPWLPNRQRRLESLRHRGMHPHLAEVVAEARLVERLAGRIERLVG